MGPVGDVLEIEGGEKTARIFQSIMTVRITSLTKAVS